MLLLEMSKFLIFDGSDRLFLGNTLPSPNKFEKMLVSVVMILKNLSFANLCENINKTVYDIYFG